jgi:hypothetical protein
MDEASSDQSSVEGARVVAVVVMDFDSQAGLELQHQRKGVVDRTGMQLR